MTNYLYRYVNDGTMLYCDKYFVLKTTPKGYWIEYGEVVKGRRFVLNSGRKRFAYPTKELAQESFLARKTRQIKILTAQLAAAKFVREMMVQQVTHGASGSIDTRSNGYKIFE